MKYSIAWLLLLVAFASCSTEQELTEEEKSIFFSVKTLERDYGLDLAGEPTETFNKTKYWMSNTDYEYEFESGSKGEDYIYVYNSISYETSVSEAKNGYTAFLLGTKIIPDLNAEKMPGELSFGDQQGAYLLQTEEGLPAGNMVMFREGKLLYLLSIGGIYFDSIADLEDMLEPEIERLRAFQFDSE